MSTGQLHIHAAKQVVKLALEIVLCVAHSVQVDAADLLKGIEEQAELVDRDAKQQCFAENRKAHYDMRDALKR